MKSKTFSGASVRFLGRALVVGTALSLLEIAIVVCRVPKPWPAGMEQSIYALAAWANLVWLSLVSTALAVVLLPAPRFPRTRDRTEPLPHFEPALLRRYAMFFLCVLLFGSCLYLLTQGRRFQAPLMRWSIVVLGTLISAFLCMVGARWLARVRKRNHAREKLWVALACFVFAGCALVLDALLWTRLYLPLHALLALTALTVWNVGGSLLGEPIQRALVSTKVTQVGFALMSLAGYFSLRALMFQPSAADLAQTYAPLTGKMLSVLEEGTRSMTGGSVLLLRHRTHHRAARRGLPELAIKQNFSYSSNVHPMAHTENVKTLVHMRDVVLITVDALRADRLRVYGGTGVTPALDALAEKVVVFKHAYTPTPHTSYALISLHTSAFAKSRKELGQSLDNVPTLASLLRAKGYQTAAFYPPAIFYVDEAQWRTVHQKHFGFEVVKEDNASALERVKKAEAFIQRVPKDAPVFVWAHFFEPHEPYAAIAHAPKASAMERYDAEVRAVDEAIGEFLRFLSAQRPGATVIVTSDHGEEFGEHGGAYHGTTLYEEQIRVPLLWALPGFSQQRLVSVPVETVDIGTTLLSVLGIAPAPEMVGDDASAWLLAGTATPWGVAVTELGDERMVTDGHYKLWSNAEKTHYRLYDLQKDPMERLNAVDQHPAQVRQLLAALDHHIQRLTSASNDKALCERALLGDRSVGPQLLPLLRAEAAPSRFLALRALRHIRYAPARKVVARMRTEDAAPEVRIQAALCGFDLGDSEALEFLKDLLERPQPTQIHNRALLREVALTLAEAHAPISASVLSELVADTSAEDELRRAAIVYLGTLRAKNALPVLIPLLSEPRFSVQVAQALAKIGDRRARQPLRQALQVETYPLAQQAQKSALSALDSR